MRILLPAALLLGALTLGAQAPKAEPKPKAAKAEAKPAAKPAATPKAEPAPKAEAAPKPAVAEGEAKPAAKPAKSMGLIGCTETKLFHRKRCKYAKMIKEKGTTCVTFTWRQEAIQAGFKPCDECKP